MKKLLLLVLSALAILVVIVLIKTARFKSEQVEVRPVPKVGIDEQLVAKHLAGAIQKKTI